MNYKMYMSHIDGAETAENHVVYTVEGGTVCCSITKRYDSGILLLLR